MSNKKTLSIKDQQAILQILKTRFEKNLNRHKGLEWSQVQVKLEASGEKIWSLNQMEITGGEPDVVFYDGKLDQYVFFDCASESPIGRRSFCYDKEALEARKNNKPINSAIGKASEMGITLLTEEEYKILQQFGTFDTKSSSWLLTPPKIRALGGAIFGDCRYNTVFVYHNGAESYYAARGFRGVLRV